jgi:phosphatidylinositol dimannoside acyltransferase
LTPAAARTQSLVDYAYRLAWSATRHTPEAAAERILESAADRVWKQQGSGVTQLEANLRRAVPAIAAEELRLLSRQAMRSYFRYWHEAFRLPSWSHQRIRDSVVTSNLSAVKDVHAQGHGSIAALPHMANWDLAGAWACLNGLPVSTVAERLRPEALFDRFVSYRTGLGMEVVPLTGAGDPLRAMRAALDRERLVCLLCDRSLGTGGVEVTLLGEPARLPGGPATLSRIAKVPLVVVVPSYHGPLLELALSDPIEPVQGSRGVAVMTQRVADVVSAGIRRYPQDWHMLQRVFVSDLERSPA